MGDDSLFVPKRHRAFRDSMLLHLFFSCHHKHAISSEKQKHKHPLKAKYIQEFAAAASNSIIITCKVFQSIVFVYHFSIKRFFTIVLLSRLKLLLEHKKVLGSSTEWLHAQKAQRNHMIIQLFKLGLVGVKELSKA